MPVILKTPERKDLRKNPIPVQKGRRSWGVLKPGGLEEVSNRP